MQTKQNRFKPVVTRIKLNPEQAVLSCTCHTIFRLKSAVYYFYHATMLYYCSGRDLMGPEFDACAPTTPAPETISVQLDGYFGSL